MVNVSLNFNQMWTQAYAKVQSEIQIPPDLKQKINEAGAVVVEKIEKDLHSLSLLNGLNVHGGVGSMAGVIIPQIKNISTALDQASTVLTSDMLSQIPGVNFSIGNLMNLIPTNLLDEVFSAMPKDVSAAFQNIMKLTQNFEMGNFGGSMAGNRINPEAFIPKAVELLKGVTNISDLTKVMNQLTTDKTLAGLDSLANFSLDIGGSFGSFKLNLDGTGNVSFDIPKEVTSALSSFSSQMSSTLSASGSIMDAVNNLPQMLGKHAPEVEALIKGNLSKLSSMPAYQTYIGNIASGGPLSEITGGLNGLSIGGVNIGSLI